jgi:hypothetical protein
MKNFTSVLLVLAAITVYIHPPVVTTDKNDHQKLFGFRVSNLSIKIN